MKKKKLLVVLVENVQFRKILIERNIFVIIFGLIFENRFVKTSFHLLSVIVKDSPECQNMLHNTGIVKKIKHLYKSQLLLQFFREFY